MRLNRAKRKILCPFVKSLQDSTSTDILMESMILNLVLSVDGKQRNNLLPFNYQYPLSAAIYKIIQRDDATFASFLHDKGYGIKRFKLFTFSDIRIPFASKGDRMLLLAKQGSLKICFHVPVASEHFLKGLFAEEKILIGDQNSQVIFRIEDVENCISPLPIPIDNMITVILEPISPLVVGSRPREASLYRYYSPYEISFIEWLLYSWIEKFKVVSGLDIIMLDEIKKKINIEALFFGRPPIERRITIKNGQVDAQKLRGYTKFRLKITAPKEMIELALNSGLGLKNSIGMGCVQLIR